MKHNSAICLAVLITALLAFQLFFSNAAGAAESAPRPNILLFIADDMTWRDCQPYGNSEVSTPNLASLAAGGMQFDACFTGTAMCSPTRQQLYTGLFPVRNGAYPNHSRVFSGTKSLVHHLRNLGYRVGLAGKTHIGPQESFPFERVKGNGKKRGFDFGKINEFITRNEKQPYCLVVASHEPHMPWNKGDRSAYPPRKLTVPPYLVDTPETRRALSAYYAEIGFLDGQLGRCLEAIRASGSQDRTIVIFTSEQGSALPFAKWTCYDSGLKTALLVRWPGRVKPGSRTDAMVQYVDIVPTLLEAAGGDPTTVETGQPGATTGGNGFDGRSFLGVLTGKADKHRDYTYGIHTTRGINNGSSCYPVRSVRSRRYKYIRNLQASAVFTNNLTERERDGVYASWRRAGQAGAARARWYQHRPAEELYDLVKDPWELNNLADDPAHADAKTMLAVKLEAWMKQQGDEGVATELKVRERKKGKGKKAKKGRQQRGQKKAIKQ